MKIDLTQPAEQVAEKIERDLTPDYLMIEDKKECAIKAVELALQVCPETLNEACINNGYNCRKKNPDHAKLTEILTILKQK